MIKKHVIARIHQAHLKKRVDDVILAKIGLCSLILQKEAGQATYPEKPLEPSRACLRDWDCRSLKKTLLETVLQGIVYHAFKLEYFGAAEPVLLSY